jgi:putative transposase
LQVFSELKNRGVEDVLIAVCDGLKGLPDAITTTWEQTVVQQLSIHNGGGRVFRPATCAVAVRTYADESPSRSTCRPVRPPRSRIVNQPAGVATSIRRGSPR